MKLILQNGYPYPLPEGFGDDPNDTYDCRDYEYSLEGVTHFEWKHTLTIEFKDRRTYDFAKRDTGWDEWDGNNMILEATTSVEDGYDHPAIIVGDKAYCGFILVDEQRYG